MSESRYVIEKCTFSIDCDKRISHESSNAFPLSIDCDKRIRLCDVANHVRNLLLTR